MRMSIFAVLAAALSLGACTTIQNGPQQIGAKVAFMPLGPSVAAPRGYTDMCNIRPQICRDEAPVRHVEGPVLQVETPIRQAEARPAAMPSNLVQTTASAATSSVAGPKPRDARLLRAAVARGRLIGAALTRATDVDTGDVGTDSRLTAEARLRLLTKINRYVNSRVRALADQRIYGVEELWNRPGVRNNASGDCEDFAIEKRAQLIEQGYPPEDLFFAVAYRSDIGLHAVLIAHTSRGDYVLDNRSPYVTPWARVPYVWVKRQSGEDPQQWGLVNVDRSTARARQLAVYSPPPKDSAGSETSPVHLT